MAVAATAARTGAAHATVLAAALRRRLLILLHLLLLGGPPPSPPRWPSAAAAPRSGSGREALAGARRRRCLQRRPRREFPKKSAASSFQNGVSVAGFSLLCISRHALCGRQGKINEAYKKLQHGWMANGEKVPSVQFTKEQATTIVLCMLLQYVEIGYKEVCSVQLDDDIHSVLHISIVAIWEALTD